MYYKITVKTTKETPKGEKEVTEQYLTDCELFAEAEHAGLSVYNGSCDVVAINRSNIKEITNPMQEDGDYYRATIVDTFTRDDGTTKDSRYYVLIRAHSLQEATHLANNYMRQGLQDMRLDGVVKTKILEIV